MNLRKHQFFKGDSYEFTEVMDTPSLSGLNINCYINDQNRDITDTPFIILSSGNGLTLTDSDAGAQILVEISPTLSTSFEPRTYYYMIKGTSTTKQKTLAVGVFEFQSMFGDYYMNRFRQFLKDSPLKNKGEFLNTIENDDNELRMYLSQAIDSFNQSYFSTSFTADNFPSEQLLFTGALLQLLISNGVLNARVALTYTDQGGVIIQDSDRWGRYAQLFNQLYSFWKTGTLEIKRSWNVEGAIVGIPSNMQYGGFDNDNWWNEVVY